MGVLGVIWEGFGGSWGGLRIPEVIWGVWGGGVGVWGGPPWGGGCPPDLSPGPSATRHRYRGVPEKPPATSSGGHRGQWGHREVAKVRGVGQRSRSPGTPMATCSGISSNSARAWGGGGGEGGLGQPDAACPPQTPGCPLLGGGGCLPWPPPPYPDHPQELGAVGGSTGTDLVVHGPPTRRRHVPPPFASAGQRSLFPACTRMGDPGACPPPCPPPEGNQVSRCPPPPPTHNTSFVESFPFY